MGRAPAGRRRPLVHEGRELVCDSRFERAAARAGHRLVAGVDEVGRGALCGPVLACAVVLGAAETSGLDDSKRLTALQRARLAGRLRAQVQAWALGQASVVGIDRLNILRATHLAMRTADKHGFNSFMLPLRGMGSGTFHSRSLGSLEGFKEGTPEHARLLRDYLGQIEAHLRKRGWLEKAYTYWFDEPDPKDYEFVTEGMKRIKAAAPGIKRMLTEQPEPALQGSVDIWCALTPEWTPEKVRARRAAGQEVWWYLCTGPKAPYVTIFIDHPGTEMRLWPWQSWQYGVQGLLVWASIYWTSPAAFPERRIVPGPIPADASSASDSWRCVVLAG